MSPLNVHLLEQRESDLPSSNDWLSPNELLRLNSFRIPKRRAEWLLGRWTAKRVIAAYLGLASDEEGFRKIEIMPDQSGAPTISIDNRLAVVTISISHSHGMAMCALSDIHRGLGCDLEFIEERSDSFIADYFTTDEQDAIYAVSGAERKLLATAIWSAKESVLKALRIGLRSDTRSVAVRQFNVPGLTWGPFQAESDCKNLSGYWRCSASHWAETVVTID